MVLAGASCLLRHSVYTMRLVSFTECETLESSDRGFRFVSATRPASLLTYVSGTIHNARQSRQIQEKAQDYPGFWVKVPNTSSQVGTTLSRPRARGSSANAMIRLSFLILCCLKQTLKSLTSLVNRNSDDVSRHHFKSNLNDPPVIHILHTKARDERDPSFGLRRTRPPSLRNC